MLANDRNNAFTRDVDRLLNESGRADNDLPDSEYHADLVLAAELAGADFSADSKRRASLRRELLAGRTSTEDSDSWVRVWKWQPGLAGGLVAVALLLAVFSFQPTLRAAVVQPAFEFLKRLVVGQHTEAVVVEPPGAAEREAILAKRYRELEAGREWTTLTATGRAGGDVPEGREPVLRTYNSLSLARAAAAFDFLTPAHLPDGYRFTSAVINPDDSVLLWFKAPGKRITLHQSPMEQGRHNMTMVMGSEVSIEKLSLHGQQAAWMNDERLVWEADAVSYSLEGNSLELAEAIAIAESLR